MPYEEDEATGIPTRAIHEAYLDMQRSLTQYRRSTSGTENGGHPNQQIELQDAIKTFYTMLRPHLRDSKAVEGHWKGRPPSYPKDGTPPDPDDGTAVLAYQIQPRSIELNGADVNELETFSDWHRQLELPDTIRLHNIQANGSRIMIQFQTYEMGLKRLDDWRAEVISVSESASGMMPDKKVDKSRIQPVPYQKQIRAVWALSEAANKLGFLSSTETPVIEDPDPI